MVEQAVLAGGAREGIYSQAFLAGGFLVVMTLTDGKVVDRELGRNAVAKIEEIATQDPNIKPSELIEIVVGELGEEVNVEMAAAKTAGHKLFLAARGRLLAKLLRDGKIVNLLPTDGASGEVRAVSGLFREGELLVVGTGTFWDLVKGEELVVVTDQSVTDLRDGFLPRVESLEDNSRVAAVFVRLGLFSAEERNDEENVAGELEPTQKTLETTAGYPIAESGREISGNGLLGKLSARVGPYFGLASARGIYLKHRPDLTEPAKFRRPLYLAIVVLITLVSVVAFQLRSKSLEKRAQMATAIIKQAGEGTESAMKLAGVNDNIAREILLQTRTDLVAKIVSAFGENWQKEKFSEIERLRATLVEVEGKLAAVSHIYEIGSLDTFYDFGLLKSGVKVVSAGLEKNEIFALDGANGAVYTVGTKNKSAAILLGMEDLKEAKFVDGIENRVYVFSDKGIFLIDRESTPVSAKQVVKPSDQWGEIKGLKTFAGNLYLLDTLNSQVWKNQGTDFGFASTSAYLKAGSLDFSKVSSFSIDGQIYVLSTSGNVVRFASGFPEDFRLTSLPEPLNGPTAIFVTDETQNVYILDGSGSRVVVVDKKGGYLARYEIQDTRYKIQDTKALLVDEGVKRVFLVAADKVYSFELR